MILNKKIVTNETYVLELTWEELGLIRAALGQVFVSQLHEGLTLRGFELTGDICTKTYDLVQAIDNEVERA